MVILAFSLVSYWTTSEGLCSTVSGPKTNVNINLVQAALRIIFEQQAHDGTWRKGEPISSVGESKKNIGNSYVFFFDLVESIIEPIAEKQPDLLIPYLDNLERCIAWAEDNVLKGYLADGKVIQGWKSNHVESGGPVGTILHIS